MGNNPEKTNSSAAVNNSQELLTNLITGSTQNLTSNTNLTTSNDLGVVQNKSLTSTELQFSPESIINQGLTTTTNTLESLILGNQTNNTSNSNSTEVLGQTVSTGINTEFGRIQAPPLSLGQITRSPLQTVGEFQPPAVNLPGLFGNLTQAVNEQGQNLMTTTNNIIQQGNGAGSSDAGTTNSTPASNGAVAAGSGAMNNIMMGGGGGDAGNQTVILTQILHALTNGTAKFKLHNI
jgi:hypothetical protein